MGLFYVGFILILEIILPTGAIEGKTFLCSPALCNSTACVHFLLMFYITEFKIPVSLNSIG